MKNTPSIPLWGRIIFGGSGKNDVPVLLLRLFFGAAFITHGWPKISGGSKVWAKLGAVMGKFGITWAPEFWGFMAAFAEFFGGIFLFLGLLTHVFSFLISFTMIVAAFGAHAGQSFQARELALIYLVCGILFMLKGSGKISLDQLMVNAVWGDSDTGGDRTPE